MDGFEVDLDQLRDAAVRLESLAKSVSGSPMARRSEYGHAQLADSGALFADRWGQGVRDLREDVEGAALKLGKTADAYERTDGDVAANLGEVGDE